MAWFTVFKVIPWMDVIKAAPGVARGAKKLWTGIKDQRREGADAPVTVSARIEALEAQVVELTKELNAGSEIIKTMAEQNVRLVEAVGILRARTRALIVVDLILVVACSALAIRVWGG